MTGISQFDYKLVEVIQNTKQQLSIENNYSVNSGRTTADDMFFEQSYTVILFSLFVSVKVARKEELKKPVK